MCGSPRSAWAVSGEWIFLVKEWKQAHHLGSYCSSSAKRSDGGRFGDRDNHAERETNGVTTCFRSNAYSSCDRVDMGYEAKEGTKEKPRLWGLNKWVMAGKEQVGRGQIQELSCDISTAIKQITKSK